MQHLSSLSRTCVIARIAAQVCRTTVKRPLASLPLLAASWLFVAMHVAAAGGQTFARVCAEREVQVITLIEDHAAIERTALFVGNDMLSRAGLMLFEARERCYGGRGAEAVAHYDGIVAMLGPAPGRRTH